MITVILQYSINPHSPILISYDLYYILGLSYLGKKGHNSKEKGPYSLLWNLTVYCVLTELYYLSLHMYSIIV